MFLLCVCEVAVDLRRVSLRISIFNTRNRGIIECNGQIIKIELGKGSLIKLNYSLALNDTLYPKSLS